MSDKPKRRISVSPDIERDVFAPDYGGDPDKKPSEKWWEGVEGWIKSVSKAVFVILTVISAVAVVGTYLFNLVLGANHRWLTAEDMMAIKDLATAIVTGVTVSFGVSMFFGNKR